MAQKDSGYVLLHRTLQGNEIWMSSEPFCRRAAWVDLIMLANHDDGEVKTKEGTLTVRRGQHLTSITKLANRWHWSESKVRRFLAKLATGYMIGVNGTQSGTLITLINYGVYQCGRQGKRRGERSENDTQTKKDITKNDINNHGGAHKTEICNIIPPSVDMVREYCESRNNGIDAEEFCDFYASKGWMIGKNKMKDWQGAVRTWEKSRNKNNKVPERAREESADEYAKWVKENFGAYAD